jgi:hypothetical protein
MGLCWSLESARRCITKDPYVAGILGSRANEPLRLVVELLQRIIIINEIMFDIAKI